MYQQPNTTYRTRFYGRGTNGYTWADSTPTGTFVHNGSVDASVTVTVAQLTGCTGWYTASATIPSGYAPGDDCWAFGYSTIGGVSATWTGAIVNLVQHPPNAFPNTTTSATGAYATNVTQLMGNTLTSSGNVVTLAAGIKIAPATRDAHAVVLQGAAGGDALQLIGGVYDSISTDNSGNPLTLVAQNSFGGSGGQFINLSGTWAGSSSLEYSNLVWSASESPTRTVTGGTVNYAGSTANTGTVTGPVSLNAGAIDYGQLTAALKEGLFPYVAISGTTTPDCTGVYYQNGVYNSQPTYYNGVYNLWFTNSNWKLWSLSPGTSNPTQLNWQTSGTTLDTASLSPNNGATGTATASLTGSTVLAGYQNTTSLATGSQVSGVQTGVTSLSSQVSTTATGSQVSGVSSQVSGVQTGVLAAITNSANSSTLAQVSGAYTGLSSSVSGVSSQVSATYTSSANTYGLLSTVAGNVSTLISRIPSSLSGVIAALSGITGTGANTVLGYFQSIFRSDVSTSTDLGGSATSAADSLQAIAIDVSGSSGSGAYPVTAYVTDGTNALQGATVRLAEGASVYYASSNTSGAASFSLNAATYLLTVTKFGYQFAPISELVSGATTVTCAMTPTTVAQPANPNLANVVLASVDGSGNYVPNTTFSLRLMSSDGTPNTGELGDEFEAVTGTSGLTPTVQIIRGATYSIKGGAAGQQRTFTVPATGSVSIPGVVVRSV